MRAILIPSTKYDRNPALAETTITLEKKNVFGILHLVVIKSEFFFVKGIK